MVTVLPYLIVRVGVVGLGFGLGWGLRLQLLLLTCPGVSYGVVSAPDVNWMGLRASFVQLTRKGSLGSVGRTTAIPTLYHLEGEGES